MLKAHRASNDGRLLELKPPMTGRRLVGHVIKTLRVNSADGCDVNCFMDDNCMSMNLGPLEDGKHVCELSSSDHDIHPDDLNDLIDFIYRPVLVSLF